jgi:hypothetical protein
MTFARSVKLIRIAALFARLWPIGAGLADELLSQSANNRTGIAAALEHSHTDCVLDDGSNIRVCRGWHAPTDGRANVSRSGPATLCHFLG